MRRWQEEKAPRHRMVCDPRLADDYCHPADLDELMAAWEAKGIACRRYRRSMLAAERRDGLIGDLDMELSKRFARQIFDRIN